MEFICTGAYQPLDTGAWKTVARLDPFALRRNNILIEPLSDLQGKCTALVKHAGKNASGVVGAVQLNHIDPDPQKEAFLKTVSRTCARHLPDPLL